MKITALLLSLIAILSIAYNGNSQVTLTVNDFPLDSNGYVLYRGFDNTIRLESKDNNYNYILSGSNVSISSKTDPFNPKGVVYIVHPGSGRAATITLSRKGSDGKTVVLSTSRFKISNLPDPSIHFGEVKSGGVCSKSSEKVEAKYTVKVPLRAKFIIVGCGLGVGDKYLECTSDTFTKEMKALLQTTESGEIIKIIAVAKGSDGISRKIASVFTVE